MPEQLAIIERVLNEHHILWRKDFATVFVACTGMTCTWGGARKKTRLEASIQHEKHVAQMILTALQQENNGK
ncbi:MAG: hypothetical protein J3T61_11300, partial [Candidatus Brocadiales bacterium]|nr:hypothetical protein [Candidatus Bathyanammoxibius sp.]